MDRPNLPCPQQAEPHALALLARLERRLARLERLLDEGIGAYLSYRFPHGDGKTDRWGRRR